VARNRKRAKERRARRPQPVASARVDRDEAPPPIAHGTPDVDLAEAQLALGRPELAEDGSTEDAPPVDDTIASDAAAERDDASATDEAVDHEVVDERAVGRGDEVGEEEAITTEAADHDRHVGVGESLAADEQIEHDEAPASEHEELEPGEIVDPDEVLDPDEELDADEELDPYEEFDSDDEEELTSPGFRRGPVPGVVGVPARVERGSGRGASVGDAAAPATRAIPGNRLVSFLQGSWRELQRVQWPDRRQVMQATGVVIGFVIVAGVFLGVADFLAGKLVNFILK